MVGIFDFGTSIGACHYHTHTPTLHEISDPMEPRRADRNENSVHQ